MLILRKICIPRHIAEAPLTMADPTAISGFKKECDALIVSMAEQRDEVRFEIAKRYLLTTNRSIGEIAHILGYEDQNSFSHAFKVISSLPPTQFRAKNGV